MSLGIGMQVSAAILSSLGRTPSWEIICVLFGDFIVVGAYELRRFVFYSGMASSYEVVT